MYCKMWQNDLKCWHIAIILSVDSIYLAHIDIDDVNLCNVLLQCIMLCHF